MRADGIDSEHLTKPGSSPHATTSPSPPKTGGDGTGKRPPDCTPTGLDGLVEPHAEGERETWSILALGALAFGLRFNETGHGWRGKGLCIYYVRDEANST